MMKRATLLALWGAAFGFGCADGGDAQVLTGRVDTTGVVAIRAVSGDDVVTAAQVGSDGSFRIALPAGARYRLEVLTDHGVRQVLSHQAGSWKGLEFSVCVPADPFDVGSMGDSGDGNCDPMDPDCKPSGDDPGDPPPPPPEPCMDPMDPSCGCKPDGTCPPPPTCGGPNEPPCPECMDPTDPSCQPPPPSCGGASEPPCPDPEPCMDPNDPWCMCKADGSCPLPCTDPTDPNCGTCQPGDASCGGGGAQCEDPMDPDTCKDPCVIDPMQCGCTSDEPNCWPPPEPPVCDANGMCDPGGTMTPENVPGDFGCMGILPK